MVGVDGSHERRADLGEKQPGGGGGVRVGKQERGLPRELLDIAADAFCELGYVRASMATIGPRFGVLKGSLYHYIESKDDLLFAIVSDAHEDILARNTRWRDEFEPLRAIELFVEDHVRTVLDNMSYNLVYNREFRRLSTERRHEITLLRRSYERDLRGLIAKAKQRGEVREDVDPKLAALAIFGLMNWIQVWYDRDAADTEKIVSQVRRQAIACLVCDT